VEKKRRRDKRQPEFELLGTGVFDEDRYFDVAVEYAKADVEDILIKMTITNRGPYPFPLPSQLPIVLQNVLHEYDCQLNTTRSEGSGKRRSGACPRLQERRYYRIRATRKRYGRRLLWISQTVTRNRGDSENAVQEALLKAFQNLADFREDSQFSTWLIRITANQLPMKLRKQRTHKEVFLDEDFELHGDMLPVDIPDRSPNPEQLCWHPSCETSLSEP
jgi:hypothetical protein